MTPGDRVLKMLAGNPYGFTTVEIAAYLNYSVKTTRKLLMCLRKDNEIKYWCRWYGKNGGYCRVYVLIDSPYNRMNKPL